MTIRRLALIALGVGSALAVSLSACGGGSGADKAGGSRAPVTLRLATPDRQGLPGTKAIERFAGEVHRLSDGGIRIEPVYQAAGDAKSFDQAVADLARSGRVDMALIPARAWDVYGVSSLQALQAPFLIRDQATLAKLVTGALARRMLQGLRGAGVSGLTLLPENLRHPFGFRRSLVSLNDFAGARIRAPLSRATYELLRALGATPVDLDGDAFRAGVSNGSVDGAESAFELAEATLPKLATGTSNITFFPKVNVLVINTRRLDRLTGEQQTTLGEAASRTLTWVLGHTPSEADAAHAYCRQGGRVVAASPSQVRSLMAAARPRYAELERDPEARTIIGRVRALAHGSPAVGPSCTPVRAVASTPATSAEPTLPDGVYRNRITVQDMVAAGVPEARAIDNAGVHTIKLTGGHLHDTHIADHPGTKTAPCDATYRVSGSRYKFNWNKGTPCSGDFTATWSFRAGSLHFSDIRAADIVDRALWGLKPFRKIG